jgi:hypothetical protein
MQAGFKIGKRPDGIIRFRGASGEPHLRVESSVGVETAQKHKTPGGADRYVADGNVMSAI